VTTEKQDPLKGKKILIVDDEPDILAILKDALDDCTVDTAADFNTARNRLDETFYDAAVLDIMGVNGYELLEITTEKGIPTLMLTAHALSPENLLKSIKKGAYAYVPKDKIGDIRVFLNDILEAHDRKEEKPGPWFSRLEDYFDKKFGEYWKEKSDPEFWKKYLGM
jgi:DNA-binding NtrC family response regulator